MAGVLDQAANWDDWGQGDSEASDSADGSLPDRGQFEKLLRTIEGEIIPRLMLAHRSVQDAHVALGCVDRRLSEEDVAEFTTLVLRHDILVASSYVDAMRSQGVALESLFLDLLAPAARRLGDLWDADLASFAEVTLGLGRLQQLLRDLTPSFQYEAETRPIGHRVLLAPSPGETHTFGLFMVGEFMRRAGWDVWEERTSASAALVGWVRREHFDVVGLSLSCETRLEELASCVRALRRASRNADLGVMVGGSLFQRQPELVARVGADATATDARSAPAQAESLVALLARRS